MNRTILILLGIGLVAGILGGLLGIGGGSLIVPALVFFLAFDQRRAHGTSLAIVLALSLSSVIVYSHFHYVNLLLAVEIAVGCILGAMGGVILFQKANSRAMRRVFSLLLIIIAAKMIYDGYTAPTTLDFSSTGMLAIAGTGVLVGFISALFGVGSGIIMVPALAILLHFPQQQAQGISLAAMIPTAFTGMLQHHKLGHVDFTVANWIAIGGVIGAVIGSVLANTLHQAALKLIFGIFLVLMAALMAAKKAN